MLNSSKKESMEKRNEPRKSYSGDIFFATKNGFYEGRLKDYSRHGLFIATSNSLPIGEMITVALPYLEGKADKCRGQIIWRNKVGFGVELFRKRNGTAQNFFNSEVMLDKQTYRTSMNL
jgi:hypothetical protein